jgi:hypothetical protein
MTAWRLPDRAERQADRLVLEHFLEPAVAAAISSMPCVVLDPEAAAPLRLRVDAFLYRSGALLRSGWPR